MNEKSMTALVSAFSRAYHCQNNSIKIFHDPIAKTLLGEEDYTQIANNMANGIAFFNPNFAGSKTEALRWIVDNHLSPTPLARAVFAEKALQCAIPFGVKQYIILAAGYDSFAYRQPSWAKDIHIYELDHPATAQEKEERLKKGNIKVAKNTSYIHIDFNEENWILALTENKNFKQNERAFCSILGLLYYLPKGDFRKLLFSLGMVLQKGSSLVFDYPSNEVESTKTNQLQQLAQSAKEPMLASYSYTEMEELLCDCDFLIYEHLTPQEMTHQYFSEYNIYNPNHAMKAADNVNYCLAVKR